MRIEVKAEWVGIQPGQKPSHSVELLEQDCTVELSNDSKNDESKFD